MRLWYNQQNIIDTLPIDSRIKSIDSALLKFDRYYPNLNFSSVFNDILGFRAICTDYEEVLALQLEENIRIEIQFNTYFDRQFNDWMHNKFYKRGFDNKIGQKLRKEYEDGKTNKIKTRIGGVLKDVLSNCKKI